MKKKRYILALILLFVNIIAVSMVAEAAKKLEKPVITLSNIASSGKIKISWEEIEGAESYKVYRSTDGGETYKLLSTTKKLSLNNTSAVAGKKYYYKVKAIAANSSANSAFSKAKSRVCDLPRPEITLSTVKSTGKLKVSWKKIDGAVEYQVYRSTDGGKNYKCIKTTTKTNLTNNSVTTGKMYYYKVKAISSRSSANSAFSKTKKIRCGYVANEEKTTKYVAKSWVTVYEFPDSDSESKSLPYMAEVQFGVPAREGSSGTWQRLYYNDKLCYAWLTDGDGKFTTKKSRFEYEGDTKYQQQVLDMAVDIAQNWKTVYTHGQSNGIPDEDGFYGFDCSGFVSFVLNSVMKQDVDTYKVSSAIKTLYETDSIYNHGFPNEFCASDVAISEIQPGDVLFFSQNSDIDHCGIYLGNNEFVHSSNFWGDDSVCIMPLKDTYKEDLTCARRYLPTSVAPANKIMYTTFACKMFAERSTEAEVVYTFTKGEAVTVLYTNNGSWAYVEVESGLKGNVLLNNLTE